MAERFVRLIGLAALALASAAPATAFQVTEPAQAQAVLPRVAVTLVTASGQHRYRAELAATPEQQAAGLMFRTTMARGDAMIFPFVPARPASFWMENTVLPLDLVFVGADHRVLNIAADAVPYSRALIPSAGPAAAVIELNAGEAARIGLKPGDRALYRLPG